MLLPGRGLGDEPGRVHWRRLADLPYPVQEIYPALAGERIHVAGGFTVQGGQVAATDRHVQYDIPTDRWRALAALPEVRHHPYLVASDGHIYALGGFRPDPSGDWVMQDQTWVYDTGQDRWEYAAPAPEFHAETVCLALGQIIHVIGGRSPKGAGNAAWQDHGDSARHLLFDTVTGQWNRAAPALISRNSAAGAVIGDQLYVVGGRTVTGGNVADLEVYDPKEDRWRRASPMPQAQGGLAAAAIDRQLIAFGGEYFGAGGHGVHADCWRYNPNGDTWSALDPMPTPRHGLGAVSDGRAVFAVGGSTGVATTGTSPVVEALYFG